MTRIEYATILIREAAEKVVYAQSLLEAPGDVLDCAHVNRETTSTFGCQPSWFCKDCQEEIYESDEEGDFDPTDVKGDA